MKRTGHADLKSCYRLVPQWIADYLSHFEPADQHSVNQHFLPSNCVFTTKSPSFLTFFVADYGIGANFRFAYHPTFEEVPSFGHYSIRQLEDNISNSNINSLICKESTATVGNAICIRANRFNND